MEAFARGLRPLLVAILREQLTPVEPGRRCARTRISCPQCPRGLAFEPLDIHRDDLAEPNLLTRKRDGRGIADLLSGEVDRLVQVPIPSLW